MPKAKVNPIHYKPTWLFARFPDEADELKQAFGDGCLALSDIEMIVIKVILDTSIKNGDVRSQKIKQVAEGILDKLVMTLDAEFEERAVL